MTRVDGVMERMPARLLRRRLTWDGRWCFALDYRTGPAMDGDPRRSLIRAFKAGDRRAIHLARALIIDSLLQHEARLGGEAVAHLVPVPGHVTGPAGRPLDLLCRGVAELLPWMTYKPGMLIRTQSVHQSAASKVRPSTEDHVRTLAWTGGRIGYSVIVIDDVFTFGRVTSATLEHLQDAGARDIVVACVARTVL
jgi:predicted amidophosphoribosyltransferase